MTRRWLAQHGIPHDRLYIEKGNVHTTDPRLLVWNRFTVSERKEIRLFVEDDLFKAKKLAAICEIVFLFDQPYNKAGEGELPNNVVRVGSWYEVYQYVRQNV